METFHHERLCGKVLLYLRAGETQSNRLINAMLTCKVTKIELTFDVAGAASVTKIINYDPRITTGTNEIDFIIEEIALDEQQTKFEIRVVPRIL